MPLSSFPLRSRASLVSLGTENRTLCSTRFRDSRNCLEGSDKQWTRQWTSNPMLMAPKVRKIAADHPPFQSFSPQLNEATLPWQLLDSEKSDERTTGLFLLANQLNSWKFITDWCPCRKNYLTSEWEQLKSVDLPHKVTRVVKSDLGHHTSQKRRSCDFSIQLFWMYGFFSFFLMVHRTLSFTSASSRHTGQTIQVFRHTSPQLQTWRQGRKRMFPRGCQTSACKIGWFDDSCSHHGSYHAFLKMRKFSLDAMRCHMSSYKHRYFPKVRMAGEKTHTKKKNISNSNCRRRHKWHRTTDSRASRSCSAFAGAASSPWRR